MGGSLDSSRGAWVTKPFNNWKKAVEKMRVHSRSNGHIRSCEAQIAAARAIPGGSIIQQLQRVSETDAEEQGSY